MSRNSIVKGVIVLVDVPYLDAGRTVRRPALTIGDTKQSLDVIIAAISSRIRHPLPVTHYLIGQQHADWAASGLRLDSVIRCDRLFTVAHASIHRTLGRLSPATLAQVDDLVKISLGIAWMGLHVSARDEFLGKNLTTLSESILLNWIRSKQSHLS